MVKDRKPPESSPTRHSDRVDPRFADTDGPTDLKECPVCGQTMRAHSIERGAHDTILTCPVPHPGAWDRDAFLPVNEFGMVLRPHEPENTDEEIDRPE